MQLVLAGHDHDYQRSQTIDGVTYVVSGGAAKTRSTSRADFTETAWSTYHFVDLAVWPDRLELRAIDQHGEVFDSVSLTPELRSADALAGPGYRRGLHRLVVLLILLGSVAAACSDSRRSPKRRPRCRATPWPIRPPPRSHR